MNFEGDLLPIIILGEIRQIEWNTLLFLFPGGQLNEFGFFFNLAEDIDINQISPVYFLVYEHFQFSLVFLDFLRHESDCDGSFLQIT